MKPVETGMAPVLGYNPESITANVGDVVEFQFMQKNHTATQSTFAEPCKAMEGGKDSGFMPNPDGAPGVTWNMTVETTDAICKFQYSYLFIDELFLTRGNRDVLQTEQRRTLRQRHGLQHQRQIRWRQDHGAVQTARYQI
jgi:hypothetical protein